jgi:type I restriction enzyme, S subunit
MKTYEEYKDSGVEWIGEIPVEWNVLSLKRISYLYNGSTPRSEEKNWNGGIPFVTPTDIDSDNLTKFLPNTQREISQVGLDSSGCSFIPKHSVVLTTRAPIGNVTIPIFDFTTNQGCRSIVPTTKTLSDYIYYVLNVSKNHLQVLGNGSTFMELSTTSLSEFPIPLSTLPEQQQIVNYLDQKTSQIDELIDKKTRKIELLKEYRTSLINQVVTKGLDPNVEMKDSGVEWIGEIPQDTKVGPIRYFLTELTDGSHLSPDTSSPDYPFVSTVDVHDGEIDFDSCLRTSSESYEYLERNGCRPLHGDVLFSKDGTIGKTSVIREDIKFVVASSLVILRPDSHIVQSQYLDYVLRSVIVVEQIRSFVKGVALTRVSLRNIGRVLVPVPPLPEQQQIVTYLDQKTQEIDQTIETEEKKIEHLKEYRQSLISNVVTGKIDVRDTVLS